MPQHWTDNFEMKRDSRTMSMMLLHANSLYSAIHTSQHHNPHIHGAAWQEALHPTHCSQTIEPCDNTWLRSSMKHFVWYRISCHIARLSITHRRSKQKSTCLPQEPIASRRPHSVYESDPNKQETSQKELLGKSVTFQPQHYSNLLQTPPARSRKSTPQPICPPQRASQTTHSSSACPDHRRSSCGLG